MSKTDNQFRSRIGRLFSELEKEEEAFKAEFRVWPFILWLCIGTFVGAYSILLPPGPDSPAFMDPSLKMILVMVVFFALTFKTTAKLAKK